MQVGDHVESDVEAEVISESERPDGEPGPVSRLHIAKPSPNAPLTSTVLSRPTATPTFLPLDEAAYTRVYQAGG